MTLKIVLTGGGTGGHAYPALSIAQALRTKYPDCELRYLGSRDGIEARLAVEAGLEFVGLTSRKLTKLLSPDTIVTAVALGQGLIEALAALKEFKADVVIGTGGYVAASVVLAQWLRRGKTLILEPDVIPGRTNLWLSGLATKICLGFQEAAVNFPAKKVSVTGMPVRSELLNLPDKYVARKSLNLHHELFTVLVIGGSQGARTLNEVVASSVPLLKQRPVQILHQTGERNFDEVNKSAQSADWANYHVRPYLDDMVSAYACADLAMCRCGSSTIAELTAVGLPSILVPYPYAHRDHQRHNARVLAKHGAGILASDEDLSVELFVNTLERLIDTPAELDGMAAKCKELGKPNAAQDIADLAVSL